MYLLTKRDLRNYSYITHTFPFLQLFPWVVVVPQEKKYWSRSNQESIELILWISEVNTICSLELSLWITSFNTKIILKLVYMSITTYE